jgi:hypothetical protein
MGVIVLGLYCFAGSALLSHLAANVAASDAHSVPQPTAALPARVIVSIAVREGSTHTSYVLCATWADRTASDVIDVAMEDFPELYVNLACNQ